MDKLTAMTEVWVDVYYYAGDNDGDGLAKGGDAADSTLR